MNHQYMFVFVFGGGGGGVFTVLSVYSRDLKKTEGYCFVVVVFYLCADLSCKSCSYRFIC